MSETRRDRRILMLGASGKVGAMLRRIWQETPPAGLSVVPVTRGAALAGGALWHPGAPAAPLGRADAIIALWGVTSGSPDALAQNTALALSAMDLARATGAGVVLHASSAAVYPPGPAPLGENAPTGPAGAYGLSKLHMETALRAAVAADPDGPRACLLRIANVAGADSLFRSLAAGPEITLDRFADGTGPRRSYLAPTDLARVLAALVAADPARLPDVLNVGGPQPVAMADIAAAAGRRIAWRPAPPEAAPLVALDTARLQALAPACAGSSDPATLVAEWRRWRGAAR